jgi:hypothetical protein
VTLSDFLSLKNEVNVPSKSNKQKKLCFAGMLKVYDENSRIRIHPKMSWIRNTGKYIGTATMRGKILDRKYK